MNHRSFLLHASLFSVLATSFATPAAATDVTIPGILIVDDETDPFSLETGRGAVILSRYESGTFWIASAAAGLRDPVATQMLPDRTLYVVDESADPLGVGEPVGAVFHVDPSEVPVRSVATPVMVSALFQDPADIVLDSLGRIILVDRNADPFRTGETPGAVFRSDITSGNVEVLGVHPNFVEPRSIAWDTDGQLLILDSLADPLRTFLSPGALFKLNVDTGEVVVLKAFDPDVVDRPMAVAVLPDGDYAIVDRDLDPDQNDTKPGAVFRLERDTGKMSIFYRDDNFVDPIDILVGRGSELWILDQSADPDGFPSSVGAILRYDINLGLRTFLRATGLTDSPRGLSFAAGPSLSSSTIEYVDESGGTLKTGDIVTVRLLLRNDGILPAQGAVYSDEMVDHWEFVPGSATATMGTAVYDGETETLRWSGDINDQDVAEIEYRLRVPADLESGETFEHVVRFSVDGILLQLENEFQVFAGFEPGTVLFLDRRTALGEEFGIIFQVDPNAPDPLVPFFGEPLVAPTDAAFFPDGRLAILDRRAIEVPGANGRHAVFIYEHAGQVMTTLWQRTPDDGMVDPTGIVVTPEGNVLLVDRDANPFDLEYTPELGDAGPGAVYEIDIDTGLATVVFSDARMREPIDLEIDSEGVIVVVDYKGTNGFGDLWEFDPKSPLVVRRALNDTWFRDPIGLALDPDDAAYITDLTHFSDGVGGDTTDNGTILLVGRGSPTTFAIRSQSGLLVAPSDCYLDRFGMLYITDRNANPLNLNTADTGAVFRIDTNDAELNLEVMTGSFSLKSPDGVVVYEPTPLFVGNFVVSDRNGGGPAAGDTLDVRFQINNPGTVPVIGIFAQFAFGPLANLLEMSAAIGNAGADPGAGRGSWSGTLDGRELVTVEAVVQISETALFGEKLDLSAVVEGSGESLERSTSLSVVGDFGEDDILLCDLASDPNDLGDSPGAIFRLGREGESPVVLRSGVPMTDMTALEWTEDGSLLVADRNGGDPGFVFKIETTTGSIRTLIQDDERVLSPNDLVTAPNGDLIVVERDYVPPGSDGRGALLRLPGGDGDAELLSFSDDWLSPSSAAYTPSGRLFMVDRRANPAGLPGNTGAVFELNPQNGDAIATYQDPLFVEPTGILALGDTLLLITDLQADPFDFPGPTGAILALDLRTGEVTPFLTNARLISPYRTYPRADGTYLVLDQAASSSGQIGFPGLLFRFDPSTRALTEYAVSDDFQVPADVLIRPSPFLVFSNYLAEDADGTAPLLPTDKLRFEVQLDNIGPEPASSARFIDRMPAGVQLLTETLTASAGTIRLDGDDVVWDGPVLAGGSVTLSYEAQLDPFTTEGVALVFDPVVTGPAVGDLTQTAKLGVFVPFESGFLYAVDADIDPLETGSSLGGILKIDQYTGQTDRYFGTTVWREPVDMILVGDTDPVFYVVDNQIRESGLPGRGALYQVETKDQAVTKLARGDDFFLLSAVLAEDDENLLLLDAWADPEGLTGALGPGALYRVPLSTGVPELVYTDTTLAQPRDMAWLPDGTLAILDAAADPENTGGEPGALFRLDLQDFSIELMATSEEWVEPVALKVQSDGTIWIVDQLADPEPGLPGQGAVWRYTASSGVELYGTSTQFRELSDIWIPGDRVPLLVDADADPTVDENGRGAVFRGDGGTSGGFRFFSSTTDMVNPRALIVYQDVTPVISMLASATPTSEGIALLWTGRSAQPNTRYLVYRKAVEGVDTEPVEEDTMRGYEPVPLSRSYVGPGPHEAVDRATVGGQWYAYRILIVYPNGETDVSQPFYSQGPKTNLALSLWAPRPNPFASATSLRFTIPTTSQVRLSIFDVGGRRVRQLVHGWTEAGEHEIHWNGQSDAGKTVASGVYFARLDLGKQNRTRRIVLAR